jgi:hypothetical protein
MTEPTRDPRLLSADQIRGFTNLSDESTLESFNCPPPKFEAKAIRMLLDHIAAQDQRHAALVAAADELVSRTDFIEPWEKLDNKASYRSTAIVSVGFIRKILAARAALAALAQPPGDK